jgi:hypothetical protein
MSSAVRFDPLTDLPLLSELIEERAADRLFDEWNFKLDRVAVSLQPDGSLECAFESAPPDQHDGPGGFSIRLAASEVEANGRPIQEIADLAADQAMRFMKRLYPEIACFPLNWKKREVDSG